MKCPICDLETVHHERDDIELDVCPECGRVYVDQDLDEILEPIYLADDERPRAQGSARLRGLSADSHEPRTPPSDAYLG